MCCEVPMKQPSATSETTGIKGDNEALTQFELTDFVHQSQQRLFQLVRAKKRWNPLRNLQQTMEWRVLRIRCMLMEWLLQKRFVKGSKKCLMRCFVAQNFDQLQPMHRVRLRPSAHVAERAREQRRWEACPMEDTDAEAFAMRWMSGLESDLYHLLFLDTVLDDLCNSSESLPMQKVGKTLHVEGV